MALSSSYILLYMADMLSTTTLLISIVVFLFAQTIIIQLRSRLPPGPVGLPFVGSLLMFIRSAVYNERPQDMITRLAKTYGNVFCVGFGRGSRVVFLNTLSSVAEAYSAPNLSERPASALLTVIGASGGLVSGSGRAWKHQRKVALSVFRSFGVGTKTFEDHITTEAVFLLDEFAAFKGKVFDPKQCLMNASSNIICVVIFGRRFNYDDKEFKRLLTLLDERLQLAEISGIVELVPILHYFFFRSINKRLIIIKEIIDYFKTIVGSHKSRLDTLEECNDLIDVYLKEIKQFREGTEPSTFVNESRLMELIDSLFLAGTETTSTTLCWCLLYMAAFPDVQARIQEEIQSACGARLPSYSDQRNMPYTEAVTLELQRLHTVFSLGVAHCAGKNTTLQGYDIPENTIVMSNLWGILHDPDVWPEPDVFKPERFLNVNGEISIPKEWIPFSIGRRSCIGEKLAKMEIFIFLTHLLKRFSFKKPKANSKMCFEGRNGGSHSPIPFKIAAIPRVPNEE